MIPYPIFPIASLAYWPLAEAYRSFYNHFYFDPMDRYLLTPYFNSPLFYRTSYLPPALWRYPDDTMWAFNLQDAMTQTEYWTNLSRSMSDFYHRIVMTASRPESFVG